MKKRVYLFIFAFFTYACLLVGFIWAYKERILQFLEKHPVLFPLALLFALAVTAVLWSRLHSVQELRSWLIAKVAGNVILVIAIGSSWLFGLGADVTFLLILLAFLFWTWALGTLVKVVRQNRS